MVSHRPSLGKETAMLRQVIGNPNVRFRFTRHARDEMAADQIIEADVRYVLGRYGVSWVEWKKDEIWHVEGLDVDGRSIRVVITVIVDIVVVKIITVMELKTPP
jgi:Domain of unknown function (DUF4258)